MNKSRLLEVSLRISGMEEKEANSQVEERHEKRQRVTFLFLLAGNEKVPSNGDPEAQSNKCHIETGPQTIIIRPRVTWHRLSYCISRKNRNHYSHNPVA